MGSDDEWERFREDQWAVFMEQSEPVAREHEALWVWVGWCLVTASLNRTIAGLRVEEPLGEAVELLGEVMNLLNPVEGETDADRDRVAEDQDAVYFKVMGQATAMFIREWMSEGRTFDASEDREEFGEKLMRSMLVSGF